MGGLYIGSNLISSEQVLYSTTGSNTNGAMTQKAATDCFAVNTLNNVPSSVTSIPPTALTNFDGQWVVVNSELSTATASGTSDLTSLVSALLPDDGYKYLLMVRCYLYYNSASAGMTLSSSAMTISSSVCGVTSYGRNDTNTVLIVVDSTRNLTVTRSAAVSSSHVNLVAYKRLGTNQ